MRKLIQRMRVLENGDREYFWRRSGENGFRFDAQFLLESTMARQEMAKMIRESRAHYLSKFGEFRAAFEKAPVRPKLVSCTEVNGKLL